MDPLQKLFIQFSKELKTLTPPHTPPPPAEHPPHPPNTPAPSQKLPAHPKTIPHTPPRTCPRTLQKADQLKIQLHHACNRFKKIVFSTSLGLEDQVLTYIIAQANLPIDIFTLDTGRLFPQTYTLLHETSRRYKPIHVYYPDPPALEQYVATHGINAFKQSISLRKTCCAIRKVQPLKRALTQADLWITGIRNDQSPERTSIHPLELDPQHHIIKFHPLLHWSYQEILAYVKTHKILYNPLHDNGFPSIGCEPCTRAIKPNQPLRAGRWWWEPATSRECGLHTSPNPNQTPPTSNHSLPVKPPA